MNLQILILVWKYLGNLSNKIFVWVNVIPLHFRQNVLIRVTNYCFNTLIMLVDRTKGFIKRKHRLNCTERIFCQVRYSKIISNKKLFESIIQAYSNPDQRWHEYLENRERIIWIAASFVFWSFLTRRRLTKHKHFHVYICGTKEVEMILEMSLQSFKTQYCRYSTFFLCLTVFEMPHTRFWIGPPLADPEK